MEKPTARYRTESEDGREFIIYEYTDMLDARTFNDPHKVIPGLKRFCTADGQAVNQIREDEFEIVGSNIRLKIVESG